MIQLIFKNYSNLFSSLPVHAASYLPLGMETNQIKDQQITASSVFCYNAAKHEAKNGRLNNQYAWCAAHDFRDNKNQFLRVC